MSKLWVVRWRERVPFSEHDIKKAIWLFCHSLHPDTKNSELSLGSGEDKSQRMVEQKDNNEATEIRAK